MYCLDGRTDRRVVLRRGRAGRLVRVACAGADSRRGLRRVDRLGRRRARRAAVRARLAGALVSAAIDVACSCGAAAAVVDVESSSPPPPQAGRATSASSSRRASGRRGAGASRSSPWAVPEPPGGETAGVRPSASGRPAARARAGTRPRRARCSPIVRTRSSLSESLMNWCGFSGPRASRRSRPGRRGTSCPPTCSRPVPRRTRKHSSSSRCQWYFVERSPGRTTSTLTPMRRRPAVLAEARGEPERLAARLVLALARGRLVRAHEVRRPAVVAAQQPLRGEALDLRGRVVARRQPARLHPARGAEGAVDDRAGGLPVALGVDEQERLDVVAEDALQLADGGSSLRPVARMALHEADRAGVSTRHRAGS